MKKISKMQWENYKNSPRGQQVIAEFAKLYNENVPTTDILQLCRKYDPQSFSNYGSKELDTCLKVMDFFDGIIGNVAGTYKFEDTDDKLHFYVEETLHAALGDEELDGEGFASQQAYKMLLSDNIFISTMLYCYFPKLYLPNLWVMQYKYFCKIAKKYEIELPEEPKRADYYGRNLYYLVVCNMMFSLCEENEIAEPAEICAFFYDYEMELIKEEIEEENRSNELPTPSQAWFLVGTYGEIERNMENGFWQANSETKRGDILVFYEKAPAKSINAIYRAKEDGVTDPFFAYYSNTYISDKVEMPAISLQELQRHPYFKEHKLIHKNFQGGSGWPLNSEDYNQLKQIWADKGYDIESLPKLKAHEAPNDIDYTEKEAAVNKYQVLPLLKDMGWTVENGDIIEQVVLHLGRGNAGKNGRTDISLHPYGEEKKDAKVVIEEKFWMKNEAEIKETFDQGVSYAKQQSASVCVICDKSQIIVYPKQKDGFKINKCIVFYWDEMSNPDKFNELKKLLS